MRARAVDVGQQRARRVGLVLGDGHEQPPRPHHELHQLVLDQVPEQARHVRHGGDVAADA